MDCFYSDGCTGHQLAMLRNITPYLHMIEAMLYSGFSMKAANGVKISNLYNEQANGFTARPRERWREECGSALYICCSSSG